MVRGVLIQHFCRTKTLKAQMSLACIGLVNICLPEKKKLQILPLFDFLNWWRKCSMLEKRYFRHTGFIWRSVSDVMVLGPVSVTKGSRVSVSRTDLSSIVFHVFVSDSSLVAGIKCLLKIVNRVVNSLYFNPQTSLHTYICWFHFFLQQNVSEGNHRQCTTKWNSQCKKWLQILFYTMEKHDLKPLTVNLPDSWGCVTASMWQ